MKYICEGMEYNYNPENGELVNNYGVLVAFAHTPWPYEYVFLVDVESREDMHVKHISNWGRIPDHGRLLVEQFTAFNI